MQIQINTDHNVAVTHQAQTLDEAIGGAADKLKRSLESTLDRLSDARMS